MPEINLSLSISHVFFSLSLSHWPRKCIINDYKKFDGGQSIDDGVIVLASGTTNGLYMKINDITVHSARWRNTIGYILHNSFNSFYKLHLRDAVREDVHIDKRKQQS